MSGGPSIRRRGSGAADGDALYLVTIYRMGVKVGALSLGAGTHAIGRLESCAISLDDKAVSRMHANLVLDAERAVVEDLGSANGVVLHSQKVQLAEVEPGERIGIPPFEIELKRLSRDEEGEQNTVVDKATSESTRVLPPPRVELRLVKGSAPQRRYLVEFGQTYIGRGAECEIFLPEPHVSRRHAVLELGHDSLQVRDLGSTVGTFVGGRRVEQARLGLGDRLLVGNAVFEVHAAEGVALLPAQETPPAPPPRAAPAARPAAVVSTETVAIPAPAGRIAPTMPELPSLRTGEPAATPLATPAATDLGEMDTAAAAPAPVFTPRPAPRALQLPPEATPARAGADDEHDAETQLHDLRETELDRAGTRPAVPVATAFADSATQDAELPWNPPPPEAVIDSLVTTRPELPAVTAPRRSALGPLPLAGLVLLALAGVGTGAYLVWGAELLGSDAPAAVAIAEPIAPPATTAPPTAPSATAAHVAAQPEDDGAPLALPTLDVDGGGPSADDAGTPAIALAEASPPPATPPDETPAVAAPAPSAEPAPEARTEPALDDGDDDARTAAQARRRRSTAAPRPAPASPASTQDDARTLLAQGLAEAKRGERAAAVRTLGRAAAAAGRSEIGDQARARRDALQAELASEAARDAEVEKLFDAGVIAQQLGKTDEACRSWRQAEPLCAESSPFFAPLRARLAAHCR